MNAIVTRSRSRYGRKNYSSNFGEFVGSTSFSYRFPKRTEEHFQPDSIINARLSSKRPRISSLSTIDEYSMRYFHIFKSDKTRESLSRVRDSFIF